MDYVRLNIHSTFCPENSELSKLSQSKNDLKMNIQIDSKVADSTLPRNIGALKRTFKPPI